MRPDLDARNPSKPDAGVHAGHGSDPGGPENGPSVYFGVAPKAAVAEWQTR